MSVMFPWNNYSNWTNESIDCNKPHDVALINPGFVSLYSKLKNATAITQRFIKNSQNDW